MTLVHMVYSGSFAGTDYLACNAPIVPSTSCRSWTGVTCPACLEHAPKPRAHERPAVIAQAAASGVPVQLLVTHADLFPSLGENPPYNEVVCLKDTVPKDDPDRIRWEAFLWARYTEQERKNRGLK